MIDSPAKESYFWNNSSKTVAEPALKSFFFNTGLYSDLLLVGNLLICVLISAGTLRATASMSVSISIVISVPLSAEGVVGWGCGVWFELVLIGF